MFIQIRKLTPSQWSAELVWLLMVTVVVNLSVAGLAGSTESSLSAHQDRRRIELPQKFKLPEQVSLAFDSSGQTICAWWWGYRERALYDRDPVDFRIFHLDGKQLCSSKDADHTIMLTNFPSIAWREAQRAFVTNAESWLFAADYSWGIRVFRLSSLWDARIDCWALPQAPSAAPLWSRRMEQAIGCKPVALADATGEELLFAVGGQEAVILSRRTGETIRRFSLGHIETEKEAARRNRKFGMGFDSDDVALYFSSYRFSYDSKSRLLACGAAHDKRVRVISILPPEKVVFEANTDVNPARPRGGFWKVDRVEFAGSGRYLIASYHFGGRGTSLTINSTDVFDTSTWTCVWSEEDSKIGSVTLSPDGRLLAYVRDNGIEIMPFKPNR
jgi:WD40 repeat protein